MYTYALSLRGQYNFFDHKNMKKTPSKVVGYLSKIKENFSTDLTAQTTQKVEPHITKIQMPFNRGLGIKTGLAFVNTI